MSFFDAINSSAQSKRSATSTADRDHPQLTDGALIVHPHTQCCTRTGWSLAGVEHDGEWCGGPKSEKVCSVFSCSSRLSVPAVSTSSPIVSQPRGVSAPIPVSMPPRLSLAPRAGPVSSRPACIYTLTRTSPSSRASTLTQPNVRPLLSLGYPNVESRTTSRSPPRLRSKRMKSQIASPSLTSA